MSGRYASATGSSPNNIIQTRVETAKTSGYLRKRLNKSYLMFVTTSKRMLLSRVYVRKKTESKSSTKSLTFGKIRGLRRFTSDQAKRSNLLRKYLVPRVT